MIILQSYSSPNSPLSLFHLSLIISTSSLHSPLPQQPSLTLLPINMIYFTLLTETAGFKILRTTPTTSLATAKASREGGALCNAQNHTVTLWMAARKLSCYLYCNCYFWDII